MKLRGLVGRWIGGKTLDDPLFGGMKFSGGIWSGRAVFPLGGGEVAALIQAADGGPSEAQRAFWREACDRYDDLRGEIRSRLVQLATDIAGEGESQIQIDPGDFVLDSVSIDRIEEGPVRWNLTFGWEGDPDWVLDLYLENWSIVDTGLMH